MKLWSHSIVLTNCAMLFAASLFPKHLFAAPIPQGKSMRASPVSVRLKIDSENPDKLIIETTNNLSEDEVVWAFPADPLWVFDIIIRDEKGKVLEIIHPIRRSISSPSLTPRAYVIEPGQTRDLSFLLSDCFGELDTGFKAERPKGKLTVQVKLKLLGERYESNTIEIK